MSNGVKYFITFALGAAAGSVAAWAFLKSKYSRLAKEEIEEIREYYYQKGSKEADDKVVETTENTESAYADKDVDIVEYISITKKYTEQEGGSEEMREKPYVITPEDFASDDEYQSESLTLYACGTLTDDFDNPIEDIPSMVGDALDHFGEYEDDSVFVRNDRYKCNYEILKDVRTYEEVKNRTLNLVEDDDDSE